MTTKPKIAEMAAEMKASMIAKLDANVDAAFEAGWNEFIKSGDELGWDRRLILDGNMKATVIAAMRDEWRRQFKH